MEQLNNICDVKTHLKQIIAKVCDQIDKKIDEDANDMIEKVSEKIKRLAQSNKDEVKIQFQELNFGMKSFEVDKVEQVSKKIHKTLSKKMDRLKEHVLDFIEFKMDSIADERTALEKSKRREELEKITTIVGNKQIYTCPICVKQFYSLPHLNTHLKSDHGTKFFQNLSCSMCGQLFENGRSLAHHIWAQHTEKKYVQQFQCGGCSQTFTEKVLLSQHVTDCSEYSTVSDNILEYKRRKGANQLDRDKEREQKQILIQNE